MVNTEIIKSLLGKGDSTLFTGTTESGKSTATEVLAKSPIVQEFLSVREANGKGGTLPVEIVATDNRTIPEDSLFMKAVLQAKTIGDCNDDNEFLGNVIYSGIKDYARNSDEKVYKNKIIKTICNAIAHPANESLAYKIKEMSDDDLSKVVELVMRFPLDTIGGIYREMLARNTKKGQHGVRIFIELLSARSELSSLVEEFWDIVVEIVNREIKTLHDDLLNAGAVFENVSEGVDVFYIELTENDIGNDITSTLLKSEYGSKEYLLSDVSLVFRGDDFLFSDVNSDHLIVSERDGEPIKCFRVIDTQGLFHETGVVAREEAERIIDMLSEFHCGRLILLISSNVTNTVKDGYEAIRLMLQEAKRDIEVYPIFTHVDESVKTSSHQNRTSKFSRSKSNIDWEKVTENVLKEQDDFINDLKGILSESTEKRKPTIVSVHRAAILSDPDSTMEDVLERRKITYPDALKGLVHDMLAQQAKQNTRVRVTEEAYTCATIDFSGVGKQDISSLYQNLVVDCKGKRLYASTVRACDRKWRWAGNVHVSNVIANDYGYVNIETKFVQEIRNYAMTFKSRIKFNVDKCVPNEANREDFINSLNGYLLVNQNFGREMAKLIAQEAYRQGFEKNKGFAYQYERFEEMLQYTQDIYFNASSINPSDVIINCLNHALAICIRNYIDTRCIVVY